MASVVLRVITIWFSDGALIKRAIVYPTSVVFEDYTVFTVYWDEDAEGVTSIVGSHYRVP